MNGPGLKKVRTSVERLRANATGAVDEMAARIEALEADVTRLERENASLWASVHDAQDAVTELRAMNERAREDA